MLNLTSLCQNFADLHSFPSMSDMYRQHISNAGENDDWIQKTNKFKPKFWEKKILFRLLLLANTFYGCLYKTSNQIENGTIDFLFKMQMVWSLEVPKNIFFFGKVTKLSGNLVFFGDYLLDAMFSIWPPFHLAAKGSGYLQNCGMSLPWVFSKPSHTLKIGGEMLPFKPFLG